MIFLVVGLQIVAVCGLIGLAQVARGYWFYYFDAFIDVVQQLEPEEALEALEAHPVPTHRQAFRYKRRPIAYVCRLYGPEFHGVRGQVIKCEVCSRHVIVVPSVLAENRAMANSLHRKLVVMCDDCGEEALGTATLIELPDREARAEARRLGDMS